MTEIYFDDIRKGERFSSGRRSVTESDILTFSAITGDYSILHSDLQYIREEAGFRDRLAQGWLIVTIQSGLNSALKKWRILAYLSMERSFLQPVYPGDTIHVEYEVEEVRASESRSDRGIVSLRCDVENQDGEIVCTGRETFLVERCTQ